MRIAVLIKQIPRFEAMELGPDGRIVRAGLELEMNAYCRRAVSKGVELADANGGTCTAFTLGPPTAEDVLRVLVVGDSVSVQVAEGSPTCAGKGKVAWSWGLTMIQPWAKTTSPSSETG